jgi:hypothetical protein
MKMQAIKAAFASIDLSSRGKRRKVITLVIGLLDRIRAAELMYIVNMPVNLQNSAAYEAAECYIEILEESIDMISSVYD